ncbi:MAG: flagellar assembly protein FliH [Sphingomonadaceae bacterium]|uniref:FliH/SctL family protein n=1 Tax=Thermaurantiacus sp. TaxID=2820283 RepID=UPI00298F362C|nr:FliH/SctL family protein [Thermaurantiacus sp.]MCS6987011.1 flagellar assembly protein FliH [Sphingomonadaceae bacterium]MDW8415651.1 FliH/SctL family protein [Thermaurantiacus sp.]
MSDVVPLRRLLGLDPPPVEPPPPDPETLRAEGYAAGLAAGRAEAEERIANLEAAHALALAALEARAHAVLEAAAAEIAETALTLARAVVAAEPQVRTETLTAMVREVLSAAPAAAPGRLHLNPDDLERLPADIAAGWTPVPDPALPPGVVRAEVAGRWLVTSLARRLEAIEALGGEP